MLVSIETVFQTIICIWNKSLTAFLWGGGYVIVSLSLHKHKFDMIVFDFIECVEGGGESGGPPPEKFGFKCVKLCNSRPQKHEIAL